MEDQYIYTDEFGNESVFLRRKYYKLVCATIKDFFEEPLPENGFHRHFLNLLNTLEDYHDVYIITTEMPFYWAVCIIENNWTIKHLLKNKTNEEYREWYIRYKKENDIVSFIIEVINEETYKFTNNDGDKSLFLRKKYYEFICSLVTDFFKKPLEYNSMNAGLISSLNALFADGKQKDVDRFIGQEIYWAMSVIEDKEFQNLLIFTNSEEYNEFLADFYRENKINAFVIQEFK